MNNIKCYYINLKRRPDRNKIITNIFKELNNLNIISLDIDRVEAIDGKKLNRNKLIQDKYIVNINSLRLGQIACIMSHIKAWKKFMNSTNDYAIFIEDDIRINMPYFNRDFAKILKLLPKLDFDWLYLGRNNLQFNNFYKGEIIENLFYKPETFGTGAHAYILSKPGCIKLLLYYNTIKTNAYFNNHPLDAMDSIIILMKKFLNIEFNILSVLPFDKNLINSNIIKESFSKEFLIYPYDTNDSDTS